VLGNDSTVGGGVEALKGKETERSGNDGGSKGTAEKAESQRGEAPLAGGKAENPQRWRAPPAGEEEHKSRKGGPDHKGERGGENAAKYE